MDSLERRRSAIRAIERLRSGLPPDEGAEAISVGLDQLRPALRSFLSVDRGARKGLAVLGVYGAGKTHSLTLVRDAARAEGFATAWLSADSGECALNHPQRFVGALLRTMYVGQENWPYSAMITRQLQDVETLDKLAEMAANVLWTEAYLDTAVRHCFRQLQWHARHKDGDLDLLQRQHELLALLCGDTLAPVPATTNFRAAAYRLLRFADCAVRLSGANGLVVIIDEVESIFTKLHNPLSRRGALRVLSALLVGIDAPTIKVALGMTADAWGWMDDATDAKDVPSCAAYEVVTELDAALAALPVHRCEPLTRRQLADVLDRVRALHHEVYGALCTREQWDRHSRRILQRTPGPRIAVRDAVDFLDRFRFGARSVPVDT